MYNMEPGNIISFRYHIADQLMRIRFSAQGGCGAKVQLFFLSDVTSE